MAKEIVSETELQEISTLVYVNLVDDLKYSNFGIFKMLEYTYRKFTNSKLKNKKYNHPYIIIIVADKNTFTKLISAILKNLEYLYDAEQFFQYNKIIFLDPKADKKYEVEVKEGNYEGSYLIESGNISLSQKATDTLKTYSLYNTNYPNIDIKNDKGITVYWNGLSGNFFKEKQIRKYNVIPKAEPDKNNDYFEETDVKEIEEAKKAPAGGKTGKHRKSTEL